MSMIDAMKRFDISFRKNRPGERIRLEKDDRQRKSRQDANALRDWATGPTATDLAIPFFERLLEEADNSADLHIGKTEGYIYAGEKRALKRVLQHFRQWAGQAGRPPRQGA